MAHKMLALPVACGLSFVVQTYDLIFLGRSVLLRDSTEVSMQCHFPHGAASSNQLVLAIKII